MTDRDIRLRDLGNKVEEYTKIIPKKIKSFESGFVEKVEIINQIISELQYDSLTKDRQYE